SGNAEDEDALRQHPRRKLRSGPALHDPPAAARLRKSGNAVQSGQGDSQERAGILRRIRVRGEVGVTPLAAKQRGDRGVCFSAEASFAVGIALIPAGVYCLWAAALKKPSFLGLAAVPIFFGIQQISEGFVWQGRVSASEKIETQTASLVFLFFA